MNQRSGACRGTHADAARRRAKYGRARLKLGVVGARGVLNLTTSVAFGTARAPSPKRARKRLEACSLARRPTHDPENPTKGSSRTSRIRRARVCERSKQQDASRTPYAETRPRTGLETRGTGPGCQESRRTTGPLRRGQPPSSPGPDGHTWGTGAHKPARLGRPERHDGPNTYWNGLPGVPPPGATCFRNRKRVLPTPQGPHGPDGRKGGPRGDATELMSGTPGGRSRTEPATRDECRLRSESLFGLFGFLTGVC